MYVLKYKLTTETNAACVRYSQAQVAPSSMAAPASNSSVVSQSNKKGVFTVMDSADQPKLKGQGKMKRTRFSIKKHLQKTFLARGDSDSDLENEESESIEVHSQIKFTVQYHIRMFLHVWFTYILESYVSRQKITKNLL